MKKYETNKLFWNEHLFKLVVRNRVSLIFRNKNLSYARQILDGFQLNYLEGKPLYLTRGTRIDTVVEEQFHDAKKLLHFFSKHDNYHLRVEYNSLYIYSNDRDWLMQIATSLTPSLVTEFWEPGASTIRYLEKNVIILEEKINYNFKLTLGNRKGSSEFATFAKTNPHLVRAGPVLMKKMELDEYVDGMYFYARDERTIQLCQLMLANIRRIDKLVCKENLDK